ncbi:MAG: hypothetical protein ACHQK9_00555 [Reyranellales bacterium]
MTLCGRLRQQAIDLDGVFLSITPSIVAMPIWRKLTPGALGS